MRAGTTCARAGSAVPGLEAGPISWQLPCGCAADRSGCEKEFHNRLPLTLHSRCAVASDEENPCAGRTLSYAPFLRYFPAHGGRRPSSLGGSGPQGQAFPLGRMREGLPCRDTESAIKDHRRVNSASTADVDSGVVIGDTGVHCGCSLRGGDDLCAKEGHSASETKVRTISPYRPAQRDSVDRFSRVRVGQRRWR